MFTKTIMFKFDKSEPPAGSVGVLSHRHKQVVCLNTFKKFPTTQRLAGKSDWSGSERRRLALSGPPVGVQSESAAPRCAKTV